MAGDFVLSRTRSGFDEGASQRYRIEVGGAKKQRKQADFVIRDDIDFPGTNALPLWTLGMMY